MPRPEIAAGPPARGLALLLVLLAPWLAPGCKAPPSRDKTDVVNLQNGDRITGEVKKLEQGKLRLKTSSLDTVYVEWGKISQLASVYAFEFEDRSGQRHFGRVVAYSSGTITILDDTEGTGATLQLADIVEITPLDESFWTRLDGRFGVGFNYTKGSDVAQFYSSGQLAYRTRRLRNQLDFSTTVTKDSDGVSTTRDTLSLDLLRYRGRWFGWSSASLEKNEALGLALRSQVAAGGGRSLITTGHSLLDVSLGLALSEEDSVGSSSSSGVVEGLLKAYYSLFKFGEREVDSDLELLFYPGITESGRYRTQLNAEVRREIAKNLYLELSGYFSHDNEPPSGDEKSDFGVVTSLGWSF